MKFKKITLAMQSLKGYNTDMKTVESNNQILKIRHREGGSCYIARIAGRYGASYLLPSRCFFEVNNV